MKINGNSDPLRFDRTASPAGSGAKPAAPTAGSAATVQLSGVAEQLARLASEGPNGVYDQARVDAIKDAIQRGEFRVDSEVVADRLLQSVQELVAK